MHKDILNYEFIQFHNFIHNIYGYEAKNGRDIKLIIMKESFFNIIKNISITYNLKNIISKYKFQDWNFKIDNSIENDYIFE